MSEVTDYLQLVGDYTKLFFLKVSFPRAILKKLKNLFSQNENFKQFRTGRVSYDACADFRVNDTTILLLQTDSGSRCNILHIERKPIKGQRRDFRTRRRRRGLPIRSHFRAAGIALTVSTSFPLQNSITVLYGGVVDESGYPGSHVDHVAVTAPRER